MKAPVWVEVLILFLTLGFPGTAFAQTIHGFILDGTTGDPVDGALVLLLGVEGRQERGSLSGSDGSFSLTAPGSGSYFLRAFRVGYETVSSDTVGLSSGETRRVILETRAAPIRLSELTVRVESRCVMRPEEGLELARAWEEVQKVLTVQDWAQNQALFQFKAVNSRRILDRTGRIILAREDNRVEGISANPVTSLPPEDLLQAGFVRPVESEDTLYYEYYGPDASVLLSDAFADTHCFRLHRAPENPDLVGLSFEPTRPNRPPDIHGTLWLDQATARLRFLEFEYDWAPWEEAAGLALGRVEFREVPSGAWVIPRWWIRMPSMGFYPSRSGSRDDPLRLVGALEVGWQVEQVRHLDGDPYAPLPLGTVRGTVTGHDGVPMAGVSLFLDGLRGEVVTDESGEFQLHDIPEGGYSMVAGHPILDSLGASFRGPEVLVRGGDSVRVPISFPSREEILWSFCLISAESPGLEAGQPPPLVTGILRSKGTGRPLARQALLVDWSEPGFFLFRGRGWTRVITDDNGRYWACGFPPDTKVRVQARGRDLRLTRREFKASSGQIVILDLEVG